MEQQLEEMRATYQLNTEKLEYNYRVLTERDMENSATLSHQKRKLTKLKDALSGLVQVGGSVRARCPSILTLFLLAKAPNAAAAFPSHPSCYQGTATRYRRTRRALALEDINHYIQYAM